MDPVERYQQLRSSASALQQSVSRAEGALQQHLARLKEEHGCASLEAGRKKLKQLAQQAREAEEKFNQEADSFEAKWEGVL